MTKAILGSLFWWPFMLSLKLVCWVLGWFVVPIAYWTREREQYSFGDQSSEIIYRFSHFRRWAKLWDNQEHGIYGQPSFQKKHANLSPFWLCIRWSCWKNPSNGLRDVERLDLDIESKLVRFVGFSQNPEAYEQFEPKRSRALKQRIWFFAWQGWKAGFWIIRPWNETHHFRFRIGFKVTPYDQIEVPDWREENAGFGFKLGLWREG